MAYFPETAIKAADSASIDAFSRLRVSNPTGLFDAQFTYNLNPLLFEPITNGSGATVTHDTTNRAALMTFASTPTGGKAYMQSYEYFRYQPGKSQLAFVTFNFVEAAANVLKFAGYSDGVNGIELQQDGSTVQLALLSGTGHGNEFVTQANWNLDKMDGTGPSGKTLDLTKVQIFLIDFQALYVGRVRVGFDIDGIVYYVHQFTHSNIDPYPYIQSANLPIRCGMTCTGTVSTTMLFICSAVISEGGTENTNGRTFGVEGSGQAGNGSRTHILSIRPKTTFNGIANRIKMELVSVQLGNYGNNLVFWELVLGQAITGVTAFSDCNAAYSAFEYNVAGTLSGSPAIVVASGYVSPLTGGGSDTRHIVARYPITLDAAGVARSLGTLSVLVTGITGFSNCRTTLNWAEIR